MASLLWVDDVAAEVQRFYNALQSVGVKVCHKSSRKRAEEYLRAERCDYVVLDIWMEDEQFSDETSGAHLFERLRAGAFGDWGREVPVVVYTAHGGHTQGLKRLWEAEVAPAALIHKRSRDLSLSKIMTAFVQPTCDIQVSDLDRESIRIDLCAADDKAATFCELISDYQLRVVLSSVSHEFSEQTALLALNQPVSIEARRVNDLDPVVEIELIRSGVRADYILIEHGHS